MLEGFTMEQEAKILTNAIEKNGEDAQIVVAIEECSELIKALTKYLRFKADPEKVEERLRDITKSLLINSVREEVADVSIMLNQLELMFGQVNDYEVAKLTSLKKRLEGKKK